MHQQQQPQHSQQTSTSLSSQQHHQHLQPAGQVIAPNNSQSYSGMMQQPQSNQQIVHQQQQQMQSYQKQTQQQPIRQSAAATSQQPNYASQPQQQQQTAYQQQQHVQQQQNNYMQMRSSILQNAHHPSGGEVARDASAKYYDQYENYARPTSNAQISQNSYNNNNPSVYNNAQPNYMYQGNNSAHYNPSTNGGGSNGSVLSGIGVMGGNSGIGKIADYDPLTDGPRSIPSTPRQSATLIYSSDRGAGKFFNVSVFVFAMEAQCFLIIAPCYFIAKSKNVLYCSVVTVMYISSYSWIIHVGVTICNLK